MARHQPRLERLILREIGPLIAAAGGECRVEDGRRGGHASLCIDIGDVTRKTALSRSPRADEKDAIRTKVADVNRILREMGR